MTAEEEWVCPLDGCGRTAEQHSLADALAHIFPELGEDEAKGVADRTLDRLEQHADDFARVAQRLSDLL